MLRVGLPALGTSFLWQTGFVLVLVMTMTLPHESVNALAGLTAGMRIEAVIFLPAVACQMAVAVVVGQEVGSGNREKAQQSARDMLLLAVFGMSLLTGCLWFIREELAAFMAVDSRVQAEAVRYLVFNFLSVPLMVANLVLIGVFTGAGATQYSMWTYLFSIWGVRLPLSWWLRHMVMKSSSGIYWAMVIAQIVQLGILLWIFIYTDWKRFSLFASYGKSSSALSAICGGRKRDIAFTCFMCNFLIKKEYPLFYCWRHIFEEEKRRKREWRIAPLEGCGGMQVPKGYYSKGRE